MILEARDLGRLLGAGGKQRLRGTLTVGVNSRIAVQSPKRLARE